MKTSIFLQVIIFTKVVMLYYQTWVLKISLTIQTNNNVLKTISDCLANLALNHQKIDNHVKLF